MRPPVGEPLHILEATLRRLPAGFAFSGLTAAWLHGIDVKPCDPVEVTIPYGTRVSQRAGIALRHSTLRKNEIVLRQGVPATSIAATLLDLCRRLSHVDAVAIADAALHARLLGLEELSQWVARNPRRHGIRKLRLVVSWAEPAAESQMESRLRMLLELGGLPRPSSQVSVYDAAGRFAGRPDLYYERERIGIEYDGGHHRDQMVEDNRRQNALLNAGVRLLRFTAADVMRRPKEVVADVRAQLEISGKTPHATLAPRAISGKTRERRRVA